MNTTDDGWDWLDRIHFPRGDSLLTLNAATGRKLLDAAQAQRAHEAFTNRWTCGDCGNEYTKADLSQICPWCVMQKEIARLQDKLAEAEKWKPSSAPEPKAFKVPLGHKVELTPSHGYKFELMSACEKGTTIHQEIERMQNMLYQQMMVPESMLDNCSAYSRCRIPEPAPQKVCECSARSEAGKRKGWGHDNWCPAR